MRPSRTFTILVALFAASLLPALPARAGVSLDCNGNSIPDDVDIATGTSDDCNANGVPDECDAANAQVTTLVAPDGAAGDQFGFVVSVSRDTAIVGAPNDDDAGSNSGSAYVFVRSAGLWTFQQKLTAPDAAAGDAFGRAVVVSGDTAVVGAILDDDLGSASGSAYVFVRSGGAWTFHQKLLAPDGAANDQFGISVSVSGETAVVGAHGDDDRGTDSGSAHVYVRAAGIWTHQQKLTAPDGAVDDRFGASVSASGDTAVVGAFQDDDGASNSGSAYVFVRTGSEWSLQQKLTAPDGGQNDALGISASLSGDTAVLGALSGDGAAEDSGAAYVFVRTSGVWSLQQKLTAPDGVGMQLFGQSVAIHGETAVVGAPADGEAGAFSGSTYVFLRSVGDWSFQQKLTASAAAVGDQSGWSVSVNGGTVIAGALFGDDGGTNFGSAHLFMTSRDCNANDVPDECDIADLTSADCNANGIPDECETDCNANGVPDECDIAETTSPDCNTNAVPDECDIENLTSPDCNANGIPDECDLAGVTSGDCNANGVPDECETDCNANGVPDECDVANALIATLTAPDAAVGDNFGYSTSISGDTAIVGAPSDDDAGGNSGSAYIFVRSGSVWSLQQKLTAPDGAASDSFGWSVSVSDDTVVVGARFDDPAGSAYVFVRSGGTWSFQQKLTAPDGVVGSLGWSVSVSGDTVVAGSPHDPHAGAAAGSAYVFVRSAGVWDFQQKLTAPDASGGDWFGRSIAVDGDTTVVGAPEDDNTAGDAGSAYVFVRSDGVWSFQRKLTAPDAAAGDEFGSSVSVSDDTAVVGAFRDDDAGSQSGSAYVFARNAGVWVFLQKLTAPNAAAFDQFGISVSVGADTTVVGAPLATVADGTRAGAAYVFARSGGTWTLQQMLTDPAGRGGYEFGFSVSVSGDTAVAGAPNDDDLGDFSGSALVFSIAHDCNANAIPDDCDPDCNSNGVPDDCEIVGALGADCNTNGVPDECDIDDLTSPDCNANGVPDECDVANALIATLTAPDAAVGDNFGYSASISGDTAIVGAPSDDDAGTNSGSAYIFIRSGSTWIVQQKITAPDAAAGDQFGWVVSLSADTAIVGAPSDDDAGANSGSAYVFVRIGGVWTFQQKLTAPGGASGDQFGDSVSLSGDAAVVGAPFDDDVGSASGSAFVFTRTGAVWIFRQKLTAPDGAMGDQFGDSLSLSGDTVVVGAPLDDDVGAASGSTYVFVRSGAVWSLQQKLAAPDAAEADAFGLSVSLSGDTAVVGAFADDDLGSASGSAYVFVRAGGTWTFQQKLTAPDGSTGDQFGLSVTVSGNTAVVGAHSDDNVVSDSGSAYVFIRAGEAWLLQKKLTVPEGAMFADQFGWSVSVSGDHTVVGAHFADDAVMDAGSAFVFSISHDCNDNGIPDECDPALDADIDDNCTVDLIDFATLATCFTGGGTTPPKGCSPEDFAASDLDSDGDVDLGDFASFATQFGS